jgi:hypothetical protein
MGVAVGVNRASLDARFAAQGRTVEGTVLAKEIRSSSNGSSTTYRVDFRYSTEQGETVRASADIGGDVWDGLVERGPIEVAYLPDRPPAYRVPGQRNPDALLAYIFAIVGAVLATVGGFLVVNAWRTAKLTAELIRSGALATATVVDVSPGNLRINGVPQWRLRYCFQDSRGKGYEGSCTLSPVDAESWRQGAEGKVRYDARNPRLHVWVGS